MKTNNAIFLSKSDKGADFVDENLIFVLDSEIFLLTNASFSIIIKVAEVS